MDAFPGRPPAEPPGPAPDARIEPPRLDQPRLDQPRPDPQRRHRPARGVYAALDLGTNNCRLLIARPASDGFQVVDAFSRVVRLGEGLVQTGRLSDAAMDRAVAALAQCADKLARRGVTHARSVATEACRRAANGAEFVARVYEETGLALDVISPREEARLAVLGCQSLIDPDARASLVFDIGGGSTEVVLLRRVGGERSAMNADAWISIPWGVVSLAETEAHDAGTPDARLAAFARMKARVAGHLSRLGKRAPSGAQLLGASGTVTTLASLQMGLAVYDRRRVDGAWTPVAEMRALSQRLAALSPGERAAIPGIGPDRADLVVAGSAILDAVLDSCPGGRLRVADRGLREGILRAMIGRDAEAA